MKKYMNPTATVPSEKAMGMPENITTSVTPPKSRPSASMLIDGARHDDIRARLAKEFPGLCQWTRPHLNQLITELRRGGPDIPALPAVLPRDREKQAVLAFVHRHREAGDTWEMITAKLNESDLRPQRNTKFKVNQVAKLYRYSTRRERSVAPIGADARKNLQN